MSRWSRTTAQMRSTMIRVILAMDDNTWVKVRYYRPTEAALRCLQLHDAVREFVSAYFEV